MPFKRLLVLLTLLLSACSNGLSEGDAKSALKGPIASNVRYGGVTIPSNLLEVKGITISRLKPLTEGETDAYGVSGTAIVELTVDGSELVSAAQNNVRQTGNNLQWGGIGNAVMGMVRAKKAFASIGRGTLFEVPFTAAVVDHEGRWTVSEGETEDASLAGDGPRPSATAAHDDAEAKARAAAYAQAEARRGAILAADRAAAAANAAASAAAADSAADAAFAGVTGAGEADAENAAAQPRSASLNQNAADQNASQMQAQRTASVSAEDAAVEKRRAERMEQQRLADERYRAAQEREQQELARQRAEADELARRVKEQQARVDAEANQ